MTSKHTRSRLVSGFLGIFLMMVATATQAIPVAFDLTITMTQTNANVGDGVTMGDAFIGTMYFDSADLLDGSRTRSILPGGDSITIAGLAFDDALNDTRYGFTFVDDAPLCIGDQSLDGCGTAADYEGFSIPKSNGDDLIFYDNFTGRVRDSTTDVWNGPFEFASFSYSFSLAAVPEPSTLPLMATGLAGLGFASRKKKQA